MFRSNNGRLSTFFYYRYFPPTNGFYIVSASISLTAYSPITGAIFTTLSGSSSLNGNILGLYSTKTKTAMSTVQTFSISGLVNVDKRQAVSLYIYMQSSGSYNILNGSRVSFSKIKRKYPAFHVTQKAQVSFTSFFLLSHT